MPSKGKKPTPTLERERNGAGLEKGARIDVDGISGEEEVHEQVHRVFRRRKGSEGPQTHGKRGASIVGKVVSISSPGKKNVGKRNTAAPAAPCGKKKGEISRKRERETPCSLCFEGQTPL